MQLILIYLPFIFSTFSLQNTQVYHWPQHHLSMVAPANLESSADEETWEVEDENLDFWWDCERIPFSDEEEEIYNSTARNGAFKAAEFMGYDNVVDGGPIPNVPEGHFVTTKEDDHDVYYLLVLDRKNKVAYEIILDAIPKFKPLALQAINSLKFN